MLQVYLVRHGETQWNAERRIQGQSDSPLTAKGEQQAMQVATRAKELGITHIISSDLGRTRRTAEIIAQACGCDIIFDSRLSDRVNAALESCRDLPQGSRPLLVSHGIALGCLVSTILGLPAWAERRLRLRNCSISRVDYQESLWLASGWVVETAGDISHLDAPALDELQR